MNVDLGSDSVQFVAWKAQEKSWCIDGENCGLTKILVDVDSLKIGQGKLQAGVAPEWIWNENTNDKTKLQDGYKKAFSIQIYVSEKHGSPVSEVREWSTNQRASRDAVQELLKDVKKSEPGKWASIYLNGSKLQQFGEAQVNVPILKFDGWTKAPKQEETPPPPPKTDDDVEFE